MSFERMVSMSKINAFFRDLQDRYLILLCFVIVLFFYLYVRTDAVLQLLINFGVAIIALSNRKGQSVGQTETGDVNMGTKGK